MIPTGAAEIDTLRERLTADERVQINAIWEYFRDQNQWIPGRLLHQRFGKAAVRAVVAQLGENLVREERDEDEERCRLTFLGVLLTDQGRESERLLVRYLEYVRDRYRGDSRVEWVGSAEVEAALALTQEQSRHLRQLIRLSHWWGGGSAFGGREWTVGVPIDVDDLLGESDLQRYVREHLLAHFPAEARLAGPEAGEGEASGGPFWFVRDSGLRQRLAADWHEAQDVCHVLGWKSCVVLCGGILEALLADALPRTSSAEGRGTRALAPLVERAFAQGVLAPGSVRVGPALTAFRALTHPGRAPRRGIQLTRAEAENALEAVRACLRQLGAPSPATSPPAVR
jgi:hypothetical protein